MPTGCKRMGRDWIAELRSEAAKRDDHEGELELQPGADIVKDVLSKR